MAKSRLNQQQQRRLQQQQRQDAALAEQYGIVIARYGKTVNVLTEKQQIVTCHIRQHLPSLVAGDHVAWQANDDGTGWVTACLPRTSELPRFDQRGKAKMVAANIDHIMIVFAPQPAPIEILLDRYIIMATTLHMTPTIVMNKCDLDADQHTQNLLTLYANLGYPTLTVSCQQPHTLGTLCDYLKQKTSIVVGQSGVGKSSLLQQLLPEETIATNEVSTATQRGRHTTTVAKFYPLQQGGGIIDSPGIRELPLMHLSVNTVVDGFIELRNYRHRCQFKNCQHQHEPDCAIVNAIDSVMSPTRKQSFLRILREIRAEKSS